MGRSTLKKVKAASVFVQVTHSFPLTGDDFSGSGSGFFVSPSGHVITNYHVVRPIVDAYGITFPTPLKQIEIVRESGRADYKKYYGQILAVDKIHDLALIGIDLGGDSIPFLDFLPNDSLIELTPIWAFGFPFGDEFGVLDRGPEVSITQGHITALRHDAGEVMDKVQIDAVVNTGNSGGPAVTADGQVAGVVNMRYGDSRVNFAVPGHYAESLVRSVSLEEPVNEASDLRISSPEGAEVFVDWKPVKVAGGVISVPHGQHTICVMHPDNDSYLSECYMLGPQSLDILLPHSRDMVIGPMRPLDAPELNTEQLKSRLASVNAGPPEFEENFGDKSRIAEWEQNSSGEKSQTWYISGGELHQNTSNSDLHAIFMGQADWNDYLVRTKVKISNEENDSRAGLIFRENKDGFYLMRLHRETNKVQLLYHNKGPFGWFVLQERQLDTDIGDEWHELAVEVAGKGIVGYLDGEPVLAATAEYSSGGRVGLYSVESKASFDDLQVTPVSAAVVVDIDPANRLPDKPLKAFWFSDPFTLESTWWYHYEAESGRPSPWAFSEGGCSVAYEDDLERVCEFTRYRFTDFSMALNISVGEPEKNSMFGLIFRKNGDQYLKIEMDHNDDEIRLVSVRGKRRKVLKKEELGSEFFDNSNVIRLKVEGNRVVCESYELPLLVYKSESLPSSAGRIGFSASQVRLVLHKMNVSSIEEE